MTRSSLARSLACGAALVSFAACIQASSTHCTKSVTITGGTISTSGPRFGLVGQPSNEWFERTLKSSGCDPNEEPPSATAEVVDPRNAPVASTVDADLDGATVHFTPQRAGWFHVIVHFSPGDLIAQSDVLVARDLTPSAVVLPAACTDRVLPLADGAFLCEETVFRDGAVVDSVVRGAGDDASGHALWSLSGQVVQRRWNSGSGALDLSDSAPGPTSANKLRATETGTWLLAEHLLHFSFASGAVTQDHDILLNGVGAASLLVNGDALALLVGKSQPQDGADAVISCPATSSSTEVTLDGRCVTLNAYGLAAEPNVLWLYAADTGDPRQPGSTGELAAWTLGPSGLQLSAKLHVEQPLVWGSVPGAPAPFTGPEAPLLYFRNLEHPPLLAARLEGGDIVFDSLGAIPTTALVHARGGLFWVAEGTNSTRVFSRAP